MDLLKLTASSLTTLRKCPRQYDLGYNIGLSRILERAELSSGKAFHLGRQLLSTGTPRDTAINDATATLADPMQAATIRTLLAGHHWRYGSDDLKFLVVEQSFEIPLTNPETDAPSRTYCLAGKIDAIVQLPDGRLAVLEYKTSGEDISDGSMYWLRLRMDPQISLYYLAAQSLGYDVQAVLYDVTRKPGISPKKLTQADSKKFVETGEYMGRSFEVVLRDTDATVDGVPTEVEVGAKAGAFAIRETVDMWAARLLVDIGERPDYYYARREVPRLQDELDEFSAELWSESQTLLHRRAKSLWPRTGVNTRSCDYCPYADLCLQRISVDPANPPSGYEILENVHPELESPPTA